MESENENVQLGKLLDEKSYERDEKHINIDNVINIDFIREHQELHEIKKSKAIAHLRIVKEDEEIEAMKKEEFPPKFTEQKICKKCAYHDLCFI